MTAVRAQRCEAESEPRVIFRLRQSSVAAAGMVIVAASFVLAGWAFDIESLKRVIPGLIAMNPATAIAFMLAGASLWLQISRKARWIARIAAMAVIAIGVVRIGGYASGSEVGVDRVLFATKVDADRLAPNRMAPNTAVCFVLTGLALLVYQVETRRGHMPAQWIALGLGILALLAALGYVYSVSLLYGIGAYIPMAVHTAWCFLVIAAGILIGKPDRGVMTLVTSQNASGVLARRLLPAILLIPPILGSLQLAGEHAGLYDSNFGVALNVVAMMIIFAGLIGFTSRSLERMEAQRRALEAQLRQAKESADRANRAKSEFLATMSHELRTPLNGVIGMTELLMTTNLNAQQRRYCWLVKSSGDALLSLVNDILDFSKIEAGRLELEVIDFDLRYAVESVAASFASRAESKGLELIVGVHPEVPPLVRGDSGRLQQIMINLVGNAIKFTHSGEVALRAALHEKTETHAVVRFTVNDTGIGVPDDQIPRLFATYSQSDVSTARKYGGTGLGLSICKRLVELMGGNIGVVSTAGKGSTFWFTVPFELQPTAGTVRRPISGDLREVRVLVVDDNATNCEILSEQLSNWSIEHDTATNADDALTVLRAAARTARPFGLAILDMQMPDMNGRELARAIKADATIMNTALVLLTSIQEDATPEELRAEGFAGRLMKPARQSQLLDAIIEAIACARARPMLASTGVDAHSNKKTRGPRGVSQGARILLAEDHPISQEVAATLLRKAGYHCDVVANGSEALEAVLQRGYDLVLMDCQMPEMDGFTATEAIRSAERAGRVSHRRGTWLPIIALTANAIKGDAERCLSAGMDDYLSKPLNTTRLFDLIESHLSRAAADDPKRGGADAARRGRVKESSDEAGLSNHECSPFDAAELLRLWGGDRSIVRALIPKFQEQSQLDLEKIERSMQAGDAETIAAVAHGLRGAAAYAAAAELREIAGCLEEMGRSGDLTEAELLLAELRAEVERCLRFDLESVLPCEAP